ncbi:MAG: SGNH/GDSL hydrolase family protein [Magnetococcales bacterium]|nr:SGNH/GDSL hydrolase family protein [Magnetococcales bacterium]
MSTLLLLAVEGMVRIRQWWLYGTLFQLEEVKEHKKDLGIEAPKAGYTSRRVQINSLGFRGPELTVPKPKGTLRLAFLGGSTTFCAEVSSNEHVWVHLVWKRLQELNPNVPMDYINAGVTGQTIAGSLVLLQKRIAALQPDVIFINHASNDMTREARMLAEAQGLISKPIANSWLANYSLFWYLVEKNYQIRIIQANKRHLDKFPDDFGQPFENNLTQLVQESQRLAPLTVLITWTQQMRKQHSPEANRRAAASSQFFMPFLTPEGLLEGYARYNAVIARVAQTTGSVLVADENRIPGDAIHFNDAVHFTDAGSQIMAERVSDGLLADPRWQKLLQKHAEASSSGSGMP